MRSVIIQSTTNGIRSVGVMFYLCLLFVIALINMIQVKRAQSDEKIFRTTLQVFESLPFRKITSRNLASKK